ncbi:MAG: transposase [Methylobacter sp.]
MFEQGLRVLKAFLDKEADDGDIDLFHLDESGFSSGSCVLYAWQRQGSTRALPANVPGRLNVIGLMNCQGTGYFHPAETTVTSVTMAEAMAGFIQSRSADKLTVVVMDNAPLHKKAVREGQADWLLGRVWFLSPFTRAEPH